jgi:hypothetical protein
MENQASSMITGIPKSPQDARFSDLFTKKKGTGFQARHRFEDLVVLNQESVTQYESPLNSPLGAHILSQFKEKNLERTGHSAAFFSLNWNRI